MSDGSVSLSDPVSERSGLEPELGGFLRSAPERSGLEPETRRCIAAKRGLCG